MKNFHFRITYFTAGNDGKLVIELAFMTGGLSKLTMLEKMWNLIGAPHWSSLTVSVQPNLKFWADSHGELLRLVKEGATAEVVTELKRHFERAASAIINSMDGDKDYPDKAIGAVRVNAKS